MFKPPLDLYIYSHLFYLLSRHSAVQTHQHRCCFPFNPFFSLICLLLCAEVSISIFIENKVSKTVNIGKQTKKLDQKTKKTKKNQNKTTAQGWGLGISYHSCSQDSTEPKEKKEREEGGKKKKAELCWRLNHMQRSSRFWQNEKEESSVRLGLLLVALVFPSPRSFCFHHRFSFAAFYSRWQLVYCKHRLGREREACLLLFMQKGDQIYTSRGGWGGLMMIWKAFQNIKHSSGANAQGSLPGSSALTNRA